MNATMTATAIDLACVQRLAELSVHDITNERHAYRMAEIILSRECEYSWRMLRETVIIRQQVDTNVGLQFRSTAVALCDRDIAWALWRLTNNGQPCSHCLDRLSGEPYEVAAKAQAHGQCALHDTVVTS